MQPLVLKTIFFSIVLLATTANAENDATQLNSVLTQITKVRTDLTQKKQQQTSVNQQLTVLKKKINSLTTEIKKTTRELQRKKITLTKLTKDQTNQQAKLKEAQTKLSTQINLAYKLEQSNYFKTLLNQKNKISQQLILDYHKYIFMARLEQMKNIKQALERLEHNKQKIKQQTKELEKLEKKQAEQKLELEKTKQTQNQLLTEIKNNIAKQHRKLQQLLEAKNNLEQLVNTLAPLQSPGQVQTRTRFCKNFVWPTPGIITIHFGSPIEHSAWKWNGVIIHAPLNQEVRAIAPGKVIYANQLAGYGLLLIIDHKNGYMSLYGYNRSLIKKLHANVAAGEVITTVGKNSDEEPELYFAVRYNGKPIDPERWCR